MGMTNRPEGNSEDYSDGVVAEINITPLTDIFLVLLIIFMVTSSAMVDSGGQAGVRVDLPKGAAQDIARTQSDVVVVILEDGRAVVGGVVLSDEELKDSFKEAKTRATNTSVILQADAGVRHGRVVEIMDLAKQVEIFNLNIATRSDSP